MAFKEINQYNEERYGKFFMLRNDGDYADVVFLYRSVSDCLVADTHYIKSPEYSGYVHCCGLGCPACAEPHKLRVQGKLFIPLYNVDTDEIVFWDRNIRFQNQLQADVFDKFVNPSEYVFRITRNGAAGDVNTTYSIVAVGKNSAPSRSYDNILASHNVTFPEAYTAICKDLPAHELKSMIDRRTSTVEYGGGAAIPEYTVTPRAPYVPTVSTNTAPEHSTSFDASAVVLADDEDVNF